MDSTATPPAENNAPTGCQCCCTCGLADSQPPPPYEENPTTNPQPPPYSDTRQPRTSVDPKRITKAALGMQYYDYLSFITVWDRLIHAESRYIRKQQHQALIAQASPSQATRSLKVKESFRRLGAHLHAPKIDREKFPCGEHFYRIHKEAAAGVKCKEHGGRQCFCVAYYHMGNRISCDWKPCVTGQFQAMKKGEGCEIHGGKRCYCVLRLCGDGIEAVYSYDLRTGKRNDV